MRTFPLRGLDVTAIRDRAVRHVPPRDAATVMLVRDGDGSGDPDGGSGAAGVEVFVFRRVRGMAFAAGMVVFPGGAVDPSDADPRLRWAGAPPEGIDAAVAVAAVRETYEECGVLLAVPADSGDAPSGAAESTGAPDPDWLASRRDDLVAGRATLADVLTEGGLLLDAGLLHPWAHWITPDFEPRRYDTRFFVARVPVGQEPRDLGGEGEHARWIGAAEALAKGAAGELGLMPPTLVCLEDLVAAGSVDALFATPRTLRPVSPWLDEEIGPDGTPVAVLAVHLDGIGGGDR